MSSIPHIDITLFAVDLNILYANPIRHNPPEVNPQSRADVFVQHYILGHTVEDPDLWFPAPEVESVPVPTCRLHDPSLSPDGSRARGTGPGHHRSGPGLPAGSREPRGATFTANGRGQFQGRGWGP